MTADVWRTEAGRAVLTVVGIVTGAVIWWPVSQLLFRWLVGGH